MFGEQVEAKEVFGPGYELFNEEAKKGAENQLRSVGDFVEVIRAQDQEGED